MPEQDILKVIAAIAHFGGDQKLSESEALILIRKLTIRQATSIGQQPTNMIQCIVKGAIQSAKHA